ncbi:murein L,D-transpeptidase catalytic domain family protein [Bdellovibrio svalbardensis]|uniref:Murein L,D-transpeptidase catalytic domain family protein n=1 Tax=Bdellovibrio svalbardensis TaxID=2972972 RepID=A0ABT6DJF0_9BACT|nr:murein L,D-transpeptidase catalytic domain family protein [Bdellovibrio svalbardensis]MDG0816639.1 murein L,D-transpeptidase catalytic domain family protein [Bdellovibrio svalbardensis]
MLSKFLSMALLSLISLNASASPSPVIIQKIISQGVPEDALSRLLKFMDDFKGRSFIQDIYTCVGADPASVTPCEESKRIRSSKLVTLNEPQQVVIIDYGEPSTVFRFFLINLTTGAVTRFYSSHGVGSGKSNFASKFSNLKDSKQTSLGIYLTGETYSGRYGRTLRMYGLQGSNDQAYNRDIVLHGAWYVGDEFINSIDPLTGQKYGRLGLSWGCPAVSSSLIQKLITTLGYGSLIMHYYSSLMDEAMTGQEVVAIP